MALQVRGYTLALVGCECPAPRRASLLGDGWDEEHRLLAVCGTESGHRAKEHCLPRALVVLGQHQRAGLGVLEREACERECQVRRWLSGCLFARTYASNQWAFPGRTPRASASSTCAPANLHTTSSRPAAPRQLWRRPSRRGACCPPAQAPRAPGCPPPRPGTQTAPPGRPVLRPPERLPVPGRPSPRSKWTRGQVSHTRRAPRGG